MASAQSTVSSGAKKLPNWNGGPNRVSHGAASAREGRAVRGEVAAGPSTAVGGDGVMRAAQATIVPAPAGRAAQPLLKCAPITRTGAACGARGGGPCGGGAGVGGAESKSRSGPTTGLARRDYLQPALVCE